MAESATSRGWTRGDDAAVKAKLTTEVARLDECDAFGVLGLDYDADSQQVRAAFLALTKSFHPNRFARRDHEVSRLANELFMRVKEAYSALADENGRKRILSRLGKDDDNPDGTELVPEPAKLPDKSVLDAEARRRAARQRAVQKRRAKTSPHPVLSESTEQPDVEDQISMAKRALRNGNFSVARREFHRLAAADSKRKELRVLLHFAKGKEHEAAGATERAAAEYNRALSLDPSFDRASVALAGVLKKDKPRGLFSKLFRK